MGTAFAIQADQKGLLADYKVGSWNNIPADSKASDASWYADYGGFIAIGYDPSKVSVPPTSFADLLKPIYKKQVAINGNPTQASAAFSAVYAAALASGGSLGNITPGIDYFKKLNKAGNFVPVTAGPTTVQSHQTPIVIWWDYLLASEVQSVVPGFKIVIPTDGHYAAYYDQAINKNTPDPAAARLWEEYLYSVLVRPEGLRIETTEGGNGIVSGRAFLGSLTRLSVRLSGDLVVQVDKPSTEAVEMLLGASVSVSLPVAPVLIAPRA
jgi:putative spermidine/putrescine transport system substrate-binding protein